MADKTELTGMMAFLDLEQIDRDLFRGQPGDWPNDRRAIFGGEIAAQALWAAAKTVSEDRFPHSLHGYFLRPGDLKRPVIFHVDRDRDGRSFSARRVAAMQGGEVIWEMTSSFAVAADGPEFSQAPTAGVAEPEDSHPNPNDWCPLVEIRIPRPEGLSEPLSVTKVWTRVRVPLPDDPLVHACMHAFTSDFSSGFGDLRIPGIPPGGPSIDHALWLHHISRADDWTIYDSFPAKVGSHRGLYTGTCHDRAGNLVAMLAQEMLLRPPKV